MFKWIFRHTQYRVAMTVLAPDMESAWKEIATLWHRAAEMGIDIPDWKTFEPVEQIVI